MALPSIPSPIFDRNKKRMNLFQPSGAAPSNGILRSPVEELNLDALTPQLENVYLEDLTPRQLTAQELFQQALQMRAQQGREAVDVRRQEQMDNGMITRNPTLDQASIIDDSVRTRLRQAMLPQPAMSQLPVETRALPGLGNVASYPQGERVVTGRYGVGSATNAAPTQKTIEGIPAAKWFQEAANRQGTSNKYAKTADPGASPEARKERFKARGIV